MQQPYQPYNMPQPPSQPDAPKPKRHGRARRVFRGYLMTAGALATIGGLILLLVSLFVEINKWM